MATYLVTGCAGFISWKVCEFLLADGDTLVGVDNLNDAYDPRLKRWRLGQIKDHPVSEAAFTFHRLDICDRESLRGLFEEMAVGDSWSAVINLAARAGVRQSVENSWVYYLNNEEAESS